ncbi:SDR family oxidoreductase [Nocardioides sp. SYSU DS0663]|uniref:SDR family oxidoreductase n=1 Tax=Nocardioides sp. SYSU DS0663 TaxID=3416445 RepID=UPI003F4BDE8D
MTTTGTTTATTATTAATAATTRRTHLVTGAGSGIGAGLATALHARGDHLVLVARHEERAAELARAFDGATVLVADLADPAVVESLALPDRLDSVVHAAGVVELGAVADLSVTAWQDQLTVNLVAPAALTRCALPALRAAGGTVVFVNSGAGKVAKPDWAAYAASKFGLRALADALRAEEAAHGVRVTSVFPGRTATPMQETVHAQEGKEYDPAAWVQPETVVDLLLHVLDLPGDAVLPEVAVQPR